ncbi:MAG: hypothetical protein WDO15_11745 [Bacteroidota bacterium]
MANGWIFMWILNNNNHHQLWKSDGIEITLVKEFEYMNELVASKTNVFFAAGSPETELWRSDGSTTEMVVDVSGPSYTSNPAHLTDVNGTLFFTAYSKTNGIRTLEERRYTRRIEFGDRHQSGKQ